MNYNRKNNIKMNCPGWVSLWPIQSTSQCTPECVSHIKIRIFADLLILNHLYTIHYNRAKWMVNGLHLYSAFIQSAVKCMPLIRPFTHIHTPTAIGSHARYQQARQEQSGVRRLAHGHFYTPRVGSNRQPSDCQTTALTSWAYLYIFFCE